MRLLLLDQFSDMGGAQHQLLALLPGIRQRGWDALIGLPGEGQLFQHVRALGFDAERLACGPYSSGGKSPGDVARFLWQTPRLAKQIRRMADRVEAQLVYVNGPRLLPAAAMARVRAPVLFHSHSYLSSPVMRRLAGEALRSTGAAVVGSCEFVAEPWRNFAPAGRVSVIYNGVARPRENTPRRQGGPVIGSIGRIAPEKGQRQFLKAAAIMHRTIPECRFVIYGEPLFSDTRAERYRSEVRRAAAGLPVKFAGSTPDVYSALANLDLVLVPSARYEATTRVILEAFAAGVPVVAFPSGGIPEVVEDGRTGLLASSTGEMARLAIELLTDRVRLHAMAQRARESWRQRFTLEGYRRQMLDRVEQVCGMTANQMASSETAP
jgi:glycosyltransferase involved in cell wall biosynthesis